MKHIPPPAVMALAALLMWALHRWLPLARWIDAPWRDIGFLFFAGGITLGASAFLRFRRARTTLNPVHPTRASALVTDGVFAFSRNPMYLGLALLLVGYAIRLGSLSCWLGPPLFVAYITARQIVPEEKALVDLFGDRYLAYAASVPRWIGWRSSSGDRRQRDDG